MPYSEPTLTLGVEEEYLIVDPETRDLAEPPDKALKKCGERLQNLVVPVYQNDLNPMVNTTASDYAHRGWVD